MCTQAGVSKLLDKDFPAYFMVVTVETGEILDQRAIDRAVGLLFAWNASRRVYRKGRIH